MLCYANDGPGELADDSCAIRLPYSTHQNAIFDFADELEILFRDLARRKAIFGTARHFLEKKLVWSVKETALAAAYARALGKKISPRPAPSISRTEPIFST